MGGLCIESLRRLSYTYGLLVRLLGAGSLKKAHCLLMYEQTIAISDFIADEYFIGECRFRHYKGGMRTGESWSIHVKTNAKLLKVLLVVFMPHISIALSLLLCI